MNSLSCNRCRSFRPKGCQLGLPLVPDLAVASIFQAGSFCDAYAVREGDGERPGGP